MRILPRHLHTWVASIGGFNALRRCKNALATRQHICRFILHWYAICQARDGCFPARWRHFGIILHRGVVEVCRRIFGDGASLKSKMHVEVENIIRNYSELNEERWKKGWYSPAVCDHNHHKARHYCPCGIHNVDLQFCQQMSDRREIGQLTTLCLLSFPRSEEAYDPPYEALQVSFWGDCGDRDIDLLVTCGHFVLLCRCKLLWSNPAYQKMSCLRSPCCSKALSHNNSRYLGTIDMEIVCGLLQILKKGRNSRSWTLWRNRSMR